jgi:glycosyltransferase involved in cell wall biosynthesis
MPYVQECVNSILGQSYKDLELVVLDNASTDGTGQWLHSLQDPRISINTSTTSLTIDQNWGRIVTVSKGEYMTMIGHDDVLDKDYLATMDQLIRQYPDASLYQAHFRYIDSKGIVIKRCQPMPEKQLPPMMLHNFLHDKMDIMGTGFMMRSRDYDKMGGMPNYPNLLFADMELWTELARKSYLAVSPKELFSYRIHATATTSTSAVKKAYDAFDRFVSYLEQLKKKDPVLAPVISKECDFVLQKYCQGITHKILRIPKNKRDTPSVAAVINQFREYGRRLKGDNSFEPLHFSKIKMGKRIDSNSLLHGVFLLFKRVYKKPVWF